MEGSRELSSLLAAINFSKLGASHISVEREMLASPVFDRGTQRPIRKSGHSVLRDVEAL
jgi:hypothetical protein